MPAQVRHQGRRCRSTFLGRSREPRASRAAPRLPPTGTFLFPTPAISFFFFSSSSSNEIRCTFICIKMWGRHSKWREWRPCGQREEVMERRVEAAGEGLPMWQKRDISAVSGSEDRDLSERRTDPVRWGDELNVEAVSGSQGINTPSLLSSLLQVSNASHGTNTARYSQGASGHVGRLLQSPSMGRRLAREPGGASEDIRAGASGEKPRGVRLGECATFRSGLRCEADGEVWGELDSGGEGPSTFCCPSHPATPTSALHTPDGIDMDVEGCLGAFAPLPCGTHFPLCPG